MIKRVSAAIIAALVAAMVPSPASASEWWLVDLSGGPGHRQASYVDVASIRNVSPTVKLAWDYDFTQKADKNGVNRSVAHAYYDCVNRKVRPIQIASYRKDSSINFSGSGYGSSSYVDPGTIGESKFTFVCTGKRKDVYKVPKSDPEKLSKDYFARHP